MAAAVHQNRSNLEQDEEKHDCDNNNNNNSNCYFWQRPRLLYGSVFVWISVTGGRFLAPLLQDAGLTESQIGLCLALQTVLSSVCSSASGAYADARELQLPGRGRAQALLGGIVLGSSAFLLQGLLHHYRQNQGNNESTNDDGDLVSTVVWHMVLRCVYAASTSMVSPVLDGLTLDFLNSHNSDGNNKSSKSDFGQERLWGAVSWAIANLIIGPSLDRWGFVSLYIYAVISTVGVIATIVIYTTSQQRLDQKGYTTVPVETTASISVLDPHVDVLDGYEDEVQSPIPKGFIKQKSHIVEDSESIHDNKDTVPFHKLVQLLFITSFGVAFMLALFCLSIGAAVVESLIFLYFEVLGSSFTLCALTVLLTVLFEIPIFHVAPKLLKTYGSANMLLLACICYMTRVVGYSIVPEGHPWWVLLFEPLHGITYACASLSSVDFVAQLVPEGYEASGQGMLYTLRGCGSVVGLLFGGYGAEFFGPRIMYRVLATIVSIGFGVLLMASFNQPFRQSPVLDEGNDRNNQKLGESDLEIMCSNEHGSVELVVQEIDECSIEDHRAS